MKLIGIDLGGRTTAKTSISLLAIAEKEVVLFSKEYISNICGKSDSSFIKFVNDLDPDVIGIDAPLSLPDFTSENYLYRKCDKELKALSPMTLGEITARAIYLKNNFTSSYIFEVYPKTLLELHKINHKGYKRNSRLQKQIFDFLSEFYDLKFPHFDLNEDDLDSILAVLILFHYKNGKFEIVNEGPPFIIPTL